MKKLLFIVFVIILTSCKKNDAVDQSLAAQNFMNVAYGSDPVQKMDLYLPAGRSIDSTKLMVLIHGGGWNAGDKSDFTSYVAALQLRFPHYAIANINYRLSTTTSNHFPAQENDMKAAVEYLFQNSSAYHISRKIVLLGASAGAHMALLQAYKYSAPKIQAVVDFFGPADMTDLYNFYPFGSFSQNGLQILMNGSPATNSILYEQSSPLKYVTTQSSPTIIFHGTDDKVVPIAESMLLKNKLSSFGVVNEMTSYPGVGHEAWSPIIMNDAFNRIETFLKLNF